MDNIIIITMDHDDDDNIGLHYKLPEWIEYILNLSIKIFKKAKIIQIAEDKWTWKWQTEQSLEESSLEDVYDTLNGTSQ